MDQESKLLIGALRQAMTGQTAQLPLDVDWDAFLRLMNSHGLGALAYFGLQSVHDRIPEQIRDTLYKAYQHAIYRDTQLDYIQMRLQQRLTEENIRHIFLKGACLKHDYPIPALRTMSDLDVLVYAEDFGRLDMLAQAMEGTPGHSDGNHRNYHFPGDVEVEFHPNLLHHATPVGTGINPGWQYAKKDSPTSAMELTEEGFYLSIICHLANHFVSGGVGVRFVLDVWVCRNLRKTQPDRGFVEAELKRFGLLEFTRQIELLAQAWFGSGQMTPQLEELGDYILSSGSHGKADRAMLNAMSLSPGGTRMSALMGKVFYSREEMEDRFTWVRGRPWLLPVAWCVRAFRAVTKHGSQVRSWTQGTKAYSDEQVARQKEKLARFGIEREQKK